MKNRSDSPRIAPQRAKAKAKEPEGWALLWEFLREKPIIGLFLTLGYFLVRPLRFTDEVVREDWEHKMPPPRFILESYVLLVAVTLVTPFGSLLIESEMTAFQKGFEQCLQVTSILFAFFVASLVAHWVVNRGRLPFIRAFFLFCYLQGFLWVVCVFILIALSLVAGKYTITESPAFGMTFEHENRARVLSIIAALLELTMFGYVFASVVRAYRPQWYRLVAALMVYFVSTAVFAGAFGFCTGYISARFLTGSSTSAQMAPSNSSGVRGFIGLMVSEPDTEGDFRIIRAVASKGPASLAGVTKGDYIVSIDGQSTASLGTVDELLDLLRGDPGTAVRLELRKAGGTKVETVVITRAAAMLPTGPSR
jgi:hypothetical protein